MKFNEIELDATDWRILDQLQQDASISNQLLAERVHVSPPTCLRRVKRLTELGLIERQVAILSPDKLRAMQGLGLTAIVEVSLTEQTQEVLSAFGERATRERQVQQAYQVSPGPDWVLIIHTQDMGAYQALAQRLFTQDASVRNVRAFFSIKRHKFSTEISLLRS
jgi:Lrp/AsnC family transcriptional regulator, leucine-responsive regulatory protein